MTIIHYLWVWVLFSICAQQTADSVDFLSKVRFFQRVQGSGVSLGPRVRFFPKGPGSGFSLGSGPGPRSLCLSTRIDQSSTLKLIVGVKRADSICIIYWDIKVCKIELFPLKICSQYAINFFQAERFLEFYHS